MSIEALYSIFLQYPNIQTDTRKLQKGDIYFALKGPNFNGNEFALKALELGASFAVIDEKILSNKKQLILVENVLATLQALAKHHRQQFNIPFIAITGSNGKTTTKELVSTVLATTYKTYTTTGNLNNHIGVPLTILKVKKDAEIAVIEMGANHQHEIEGYCTYTLPNYGLITNCGKAHLEGFGGIDGVKKGKGELYDFLRFNKGCIFLNTDYDYLLEMSKGISNSFTYGSNNANIVGSVISADPFLSVSIEKPKKCIINTQLVGSYNLPNILSAVAVGIYFKIPIQIIEKAISAYTPSNSRSQMVEKGTNKFILDAYNANPSSMKLAIENFSLHNNAKKVLMLGAMMELGNESLFEHQQLVELIQKHQWLNVVLVGGDFEKVEHPFLYFENVNDAKSWFEKQQFEQTSFLIKGSRSTKMEQILS